MRQNRETRTSINKMFGSALSILLHRGAHVYRTLYHVRGDQLTILRTHNMIIFFFIYNFLLALYNTASNLYILIELIDFYPLRAVEKREYQTHDNIYGKNCFYIAFSDD